MIGMPLSQLPTLPGAPTVNDIVEVSRPRAGEPDLFDSYQTLLAYLVPMDATTGSKGVGEIATMEEALAGESQQLGISVDDLGLILADLLQNRIVGVDGISIVYENGFITISAV